MGGERGSRGPAPGADTPLRRRLELREELVLAALPTVTVLVMLAVVEAFSGQRLLFASLASSAFLIYLDPHHGMNTARSLVVSHGTAAAAGLVAFRLLGHGYAAGAIAMVATILLIVLLDAVHPPAVSTSLVFSLRPGAEDEVPLFASAVAIVMLLVALQRVAVWLLARLTRA